MTWLSDAAPTAALKTVPDLAAGNRDYQLVVDSLAALAWATYTALLGFVGGSQFRDALWQPLLIGIGVALALGVAAEAVREVRSRDSLVEDEEL